LTGPPATEHDPVGVRSALRKLGVQRIIIKPVADGWTFEGVADLGRLVNNKGKTAPSDTSPKTGGAALEATCRIPRTRQAAQKGPDARRRPTAAREAYSLYVERAAGDANEADGPFSAAC